MLKFDFDMMTMGIVPCWTEHFTGWPNVPIDYLEIGVYEGQSGCWMLQNVLIHPDSSYVGIDPWIYSQRPEEVTTREIETHARQNLEEVGSDKVTLFKGPSINWLYKFDSNSKDIIYIDGDHFAPAVLADSCECWRILKPGGLLIWDDYEGGSDKKDITQKPKTAINSFLMCYEGLYEFAWKNWQCAIWKGKRNEYYGPITLA